MIMIKYAIKFKNGSYWCSFTQVDAELTKAWTFNKPSGALNTINVNKLTDCDVVPVELTFGVGAKDIKELTELTFGQFFSIFGGVYEKGFEPIIVEETGDDELKVFFKFMSNNGEQDLANSEKLSSYLSFHKVAHYYDNNRFFIKTADFNKVFPRFL